MPLTRSIIARLSQALYDRFIAACASLGIGRAEGLRRAVSEWLERQGK